MLGHNGQQSTWLRPQSREVIVGATKGTTGSTKRRSGGGHIATVECVESVVDASISLLQWAAGSESRKGQTDKGQGRASHDDAEVLPDALSHSPLAAKNRRNKQRSEGDTTNDR